MAKSDPQPLAEQKPGHYSDGHPLDEIQYLESKLILKPERFVSAKVFVAFGEIVARTAKDLGIGFDTKGIVFKSNIREVVFLDTADFRLYNNAFILRRRVAFEDGFPVGEPEIVFKFRHPDLQTAAELDVRPHGIGKYRIKFKAEALPLKDRVGGYRMLYSHNVQFPLSHTPDVDRSALTNIARAFPALAGLTITEGEHVELVNQTIVEEVLQDLGTLDFGKGVTADANIALWRERGTHAPLCGEFAFEAKFERRSDVREKARVRGREFFLALQQAASDWLSLDTTKTGLVYRLKGNPPQSHE